MKEYYWLVKGVDAAGAPVMSMLKPARTVLGAVKAARAYARRVHYHSTCVVFIYGDDISPVRKDTCIGGTITRNWHTQYDKTGGSGRKTS